MLPLGAARCEGVAGTAAEAAQGREAGLPLRAVVHVHRCVGDGSAAQDAGRETRGVGGQPQPAAAPSGRAGPDAGAVKPVAAGKDASKGTGKLRASVFAPPPVAVVEPFELVAGEAKPAAFHIATTSMNAHSILRELRISKCF